MNNKVYKISVIESERGWGSKIDDYMVCLTHEDAILFKKEFNSDNNLDVVPDWYMYADGEPISIEIKDNQFNYLKENKRVWFKSLKRIK